MLRNPKTLGKKKSSFLKVNSYMKTCINYYLINTPGSFQENTRVIKEKNIRILFS